VESEKLLGFCFCLCLILGFIVTGVRIWGVIAKAGMDDDDDDDDDVLQVTA
jgi:hypothetical protein